MIVSFHLPKVDRHRRFALYPRSRVNIVFNTSEYGDKWGLGPHLRRLSKHQQTLQQPFLTLQHSFRQLYPFFDVYGWFRGRKAPFASLMASSSLGLMAWLGFPELMSSHQQSTRGRFHGQHRRGGFRGLPETRQASQCSPWWWQIRDRTKTATKRMVNRTPGSLLIFLLPVAVFHQNSCPVRVAI